MGAPSGRRPTRAYYLYGICLRSAWPLPYRLAPASSPVQIGLVRGTPTHFASALEEARTVRGPAAWDRGVALADGRIYLRWPRRFEFLVSSDGRRIAARALGQDAREAFHTFLLGQALSFGLIKQGLEPLHATVLSIDGAAVAFLGDSGYGKSSLAAAFIEAGHRLLTDDLLLVTEARAGFVAHPGPPRIKLFPRIARRFLGPHAQGRRIVRGRAKLVIPLKTRQVCGAAIPLASIYVIAPARPRHATPRVTIRRLKMRSACLELLRNTFNTAVTDTNRLTRQLTLAANMAAHVPVSLLSYPRTLPLLPSVRDAILADLARGQA